MSSGDIEPFDWSRRFFGLGRRGFFEDMFRGFDQMKREMEREFEDMEKRIPKDLIREYTTSEGGKVREVGPSNRVEVKSEDPQRKYHRTFEIPPETDIETAKSAYNNGILEITFKKKVQPKGKRIKIE